MRILVSYFFDEQYIPLGFSLLEGLRQLGHEVHGFDCTPEHWLWRWLLKPLHSAGRRLRLSDQLAIQGPFGRQGYKRHLLFAELQVFRPEVLIVLRARDYLRIEDMQRIKSEFGVRHTIGWNVEGPNVPFAIDQEALLYDDYYSMHQCGVHNSQVQRLPVCAVDSRRYYCTERQFSQRLMQPVLVSGWNARRQQWMSALIDAGVPIYGSKEWVRHNADNVQALPYIHPEGCWGEALTRLYNRVSIGLNIQGWDPQLDGCCNLRVFDIPACGALLLAEYSEELAEYFSLGAEADSFRCPEELIDKVNYYQRHQDVMERMARAGFSRVQRLPTYADRARQLLAGYDYPLG